MESLFLNPRPVREMCGEWSVINKFRFFRELRERGRWQKRFLKSEFTLFKNLLLLSHVVQFVKCWWIFLFLSSRPPAKVRLGSFTSWSCNEGKWIYIDGIVLFCQSKPSVCFVLFLPFLLSSSLFVKLPWLIILYATAPKMRIIFWGIVSWTNQGYICHKVIHGKPTLVTICSQKS